MVFSCLPIAEPASLQRIFSNLQLNIGPWLNSMGHKTQQAVIWWNREIVSRKVSGTGW